MDVSTQAGRDELRRAIVQSKTAFAPEDSFADARASLTVADLLAFLDDADAREKLQRFKSWVHGFLDAKGIPHHPPGTHGAEGCRIGDRMDYVFAKLADAGEWRPIATAPKDGTEANMLLSDGRYVLMGWWDADDGEWYQTNSTETWGGPLYPTHWRPLPTPPARAATEMTK